MSARDKAGVVCVVLTVAVLPVSPLLILPLWIGYLLALDSL